MEKFWGLIVKPGSCYRQKVENPFRTTKVCLELGSQPQEDVTTLILEIDNKEFILTHLGPGKLTDSLEITIEGGADIAFRCEGKATLHLTGYELLDDDDDSDEDDEEMGFDASLLGESILNGRKRKLQDAEGDAKKKKNEVEKAVKKARETSNDIAKKAKKITKEDLIDDDDSEDEEDSDSEEDSLDIPMRENGEDEEDDSEEDEDSEDEDEDEEEKEAEWLKKKGKNDQKKAKPVATPQKKPKLDLTNSSKKDKSGGATSSKKDKQHPKDEKSKSNNATPSNKGKPQAATPSTKGKPDMATPSTKGKSHNATPMSKEKPANATPKPQKTPKRTLKGGIMVEDLKVGSGPEAKRGKRVGMFYKGTLATNNKQFDAKLDGTPFQFKLGMGEVIKGWDVGLEGMKVGGKRKLTIPPKMAYGSEKIGKIPPNSTLVFEVDCKHVN